MQGERWRPAGGPLALPARVVDRVAQVERRERAIVREMVAGIFRRVKVTWAAGTLERVLAEVGEDAPHFVPRQYPRLRAWVSGEGRPLEGEGGPEQGPQGRRVASGSGGVLEVASGGDTFSPLVWIPASSGGTG